MIFSIKLGKKYVEDGFDIFNYVGSDYGFTPVKIKDNIVDSLRYSIDNGILGFYPGHSKIITDTSTCTISSWPDEGFISINFDKEENLKEFMRLYLLEGQK